MTITSDGLYQRLYEFVAQYNPGDVITRAAFDEFFADVETGVNEGISIGRNGRTYYLGAFSSAPTTDGNGDPLQSGAIYSNTVLKAISLWDGTQWVDPFTVNEFADASSVLADPETGYEDGRVFRTRSEGFSYAVTTGSGQLQTAGGTEINAIQTADGYTTARQHGALPDTDATVAIQNAIDAVVYGGASGTSMRCGVKVDVASANISDNAKSAD